MCRENTSVSRRSYRARPVGGRGWRGVLKLPELRELQEHVVPVHGRDDDADGAKTEAAFSHVVAQEGQRSVEEQVPDSRTASRLVHLARGVGRVAIDRLEMIRDVAIGKVLQLAP